ncbi:MAG: RNA 3'-terminal phosphate cyclase [Rhodospirillaceae bacterium]
MTEDLLTIDGARGEGGGQILRTALSLSLVTGRAFRIERIRAGRAKPGLLRQHLTAVQAAAAVGQARVDGAEIGSPALTFEPRACQGGTYQFAVGTAGSATLVLQTVLVPLLLAPSPSSLTLEGGTHNPFAPPFDFLASTFMPVINRMGPTVEARLVRHGFYPAGGGRFVVSIQPVPRLQPVDVLDRNGTVVTSARVLLANVPAHVGAREIAAIRRRLNPAGDACRIEEVRDSAGPGNVVMIELRSEHIVEMVTAFGEKGVSAEAVADRAVDEARAYLSAGVPVGAHLSDQLLVPFAVAGGGSFRTVAPTPHTRTNAEVIAQFLPVRIGIEPDGGDAWLVTISTSEGGVS